MIQKRWNTPWKRSTGVGYGLLAVLLLVTLAVQHLPSWARAYAQHVYPVLSRGLSGFSNLFPFALGDLFIGGSLLGLAVYPFYARFRHRFTWKKIVRHELTYLCAVYVWFYLAWGLNYAQPHFYQRTSIAPVSFEAEAFTDFVHDYVRQLNASYTPLPAVHPDLVCEEVVRLYHQLSDSLAVHRPPWLRPRAKTMLFTPLMSKVGVTGSMGPFFCEFTLNGDLQPVNYPATYAHELAHLLGITSEAEANFYAYQVCTRSSVSGIRFSGYFSVLGHVLHNARQLLPAAQFEAVKAAIRPEIRQLAHDNQAYWAAKYSPLIGACQEWLYNLYLKGNRIRSGTQNYSEVVGLLLSYRAHRSTL